MSASCVNRWPRSEAAMHTKDRKPWAGNPAAFEVDQQTHLNAALDPEQDKAFAVFLFNSGAAGFAETQAKFRCNPEWRSA